MQLEKNPTVGHGPYTHTVPAVPNQVVEMRDAHHKGTAIWRRDDACMPFVFVSFDWDRVYAAERVVLLLDPPEDLPEPNAVDLDTVMGLALVGVDQHDDLSWLDPCTEILWDSSREADYAAAEEAVLRGEALGCPFALVHLPGRLAARKARAERDGADA